MRPILACSLLCAVWGTGGPAAAQQPDPARPVPHFDARQVTPEYVGPVDPHVDAATLAEIRIGYFGPSDPAHPLYGNLWRAAERAIADANRRGGYAGKPYRLLPVWSENPWGSGVKQLTQLVYRDRVWALVGGVDGPTTHLAEQVVVKARLALVSPVSTDKTVNLTNVAWMFSLAPHDRLVAEALSAELAQRAAAAARRLVLVTTNDHDAYLLTRELRRALAEHRVLVQHQFEYAPQSRASDALVRECLAAQPDEVLVIANPLDSLDLVRALRQAGFPGRIYGGPAFGRAPFVRQVGDAAGELVFPQLHAPQSPAEVASSDGCDDYAALQTYDAVQLVTAAIEQAGLNRVAIGQALRDLSPLVGQSGRIEWDAPGSNSRRPTLATLVDGRLTPLPSRPSPVLSVESP